MHLSIRTIHLIAVSDSTASIRDLLNAQTGKLVWGELARHFARGVVVCVDPAEDLVEVAVSLVADAHSTIGQMVEEGKVHRANDQDAVRWQQNDPIFWAVVVAPWVLVQETESAPDQSPPNHPI